MRLHVRKPTLELAAVSSSDVSNQILDQPLSSDEIAEDTHAFSSPMLGGYRIYKPEHAALDGTWTLPGLRPV
jgi:hypothetical protein